MGFWFRTLRLENVRSTVIEQIHSSWHFLERWVEREESESLRFVRSRELQNSMLVMERRGEDGSNDEAGRLCP